MQVLVGQISPYLQILFPSIVPPNFILPASFFSVFRQIPFQVSLTSNLLGGPVTLGLQTGFDYNGNLVGASTRAYSFQYVATGAQIVINPTTFAGPITYTISSSFYPFNTWAGPLAPVTGSIPQVTPGWAPDSGNTDTLTDFHVLSFITLPAYSP